MVSGANIVEIEGKERRLERATFALFLRLVTALFETANGFLPKGSMRGTAGLAAEGYYTSDGAEQAIGRLRKALRPEFDSLIEVSAGNIRLSTHRRYVKVSGPTLAQHADKRVQALAQRISYVGD